MPKVGVICASQLTNVAVNVTKAEDSLNLYAQRIAAESIQGLRNAIVFFEKRGQDTSVLKGMLKERLTQST